MKIKRLLSVILLLPLCGWAQQHQQPYREDPYGMEGVKSLVQMNGISIGPFETFNHTLGDRVSVALLKLYPVQDLLKPEMIRAYLPVIKAAFEEPSRIRYREDLRPDITLFLLRFLENNLKDALLKKQVGALEAELAKLQPLVAPASR
jgi:hypothetical protein